MQLLNKPTCIPSKTVYCFFLVFLSCSVIAQSQDNPLLRSNIQPIYQKLDSLDKKFSTDTLTSKAKKKLTRLEAKKQRAQQKLEKLKNKNQLAQLEREARKKLDSHNSNIIFNQSQSKVEQFTDSLLPTQQLNSQYKKMDSVQSRISAKVDSLQHIKLPDIGITKSIDSLKQKIETLRADGLLKEAAKAESKLATMQEKTTATMQLGHQKNVSLQKGLSKKLNVLNSEGGLGDSVRVDNVKLPGVNNPLPNVVSGINTPQLNTQLPSIHGLPTANGQVGSVTLPSINGSANSILPTGSAVNTNIDIGKPGLPSLDSKNTGLGEVSNGLDDVSNPTKEIGSYQEQLNNISKNGLSDDKLNQEIEASGASMAGGKQLENQLTDLEKQKAMMQKWNSDPEYRKEMAVNQAKEQAVNHFAGREKELSAAVDQLSKAKSKIKDAEQVVDIFKKPANPMKGKPFRERLDLGISMQLLSRSDVLMLDFNPYVGYRISGRFTAGIGWVQRLPVNTKNYSIVEVEDVFGPRSYLQFKIKGSAYLKAEVEFLNEFERVSGIGPSSERGRKWITDYLVGYKQSFKISKKLGGHFQVLYNLFDPYHQSPYVERINIRFGLEFPQKKTVKK